MPSPRPGLAGILAAAVLVSPAAALATPSRTVAGTVTLGGDVTYDTLTVTSTGKITVSPYAMGMSTGWLNIKANTITVQAMGAIVADGAGYPGQDGKAGVCSMLSTMTMCAQAGSAMGDPGGGGGFFGKGGNGATEAMAGTCLDLMGAAAGGAAFFNNATMMLDLGSAGGACNITGPATAGYAGGGGIRLSAAVIVIDGTVSANGNGWDGTIPHIGGVGPGGGSGGAIEIFAASLTGTGTLAVNGGAGAHGNGVGANPPPNNGGGGSGGVVLLHLPPGVSMSPITVQANGGKTGDCPTLAGAMGGTVLAPLPDNCIDVDSDGYESTQCGGTDCDDSDRNVHPGALEVCNGKDNNCSGHVGGNTPDCTMLGLVCGMMNGMAMCVAPNDGGVGDGGDSPRFVDFGGGCAVGQRGDIAAAIATGGLALLALAARRKRRR
jgi:hypothetical protein